MGTNAGVYALFVIFVAVVTGERVSKKIYYEVAEEAFAACFRRLNATHQIGCSSDPGGNVGVLQYIQSDANVTWLLDRGPHAPYVAILTVDMFNREVVNKLQKSGKVNGILVDYSNVANNTPAEFSNDLSCPNGDADLYKDDPRYAHCRNVTWNPLGSGLFYGDFHFPIVILKNESDVDFLINNCALKYNEPIRGVPRDYPLCSAHVKDSMDAAVNTPTCIRRSRPRNLNPQTFCDPMDGWNIFGFTSPPKQDNLTAPLQNNSVVMAVTRMDGWSMFENVYPSAESTVSGLVTLLAAAEALGHHSVDLPPERPVLFMVFNGEAFDYSGSVRTVYDMQNKAWPTTLAAGEEGLQPLNLEHIDVIMETSQMGITPTSTVYTHTDPISRDTKVMDLLRLYKESAPNGLSVVAPPSDQPLPPASAYSFLAKRNISTTVLADHLKEYSNKYYHSIYDLEANIGLDLPENESLIENSETAKHLSWVATAMARTLYRQSSGNSRSEAAKIEANTTLITELLYCFLKNANCSLFNSTIAQHDFAGFRKMNAAFSYYMGPGGAGGSNPLFHYIDRLLSRFLGEKIETKNFTTCVNQTNNFYHYKWMQGRDPSSNGSCYKSCTGKHSAKSPAFVIDGYDFDSNKYPAWTESRWQTDSMRVRVFLSPSKKQEIAVLVAGMLLFIAFLAIGYLCQHKGALIYPSRHRRQLVSLVDSN